MDNEKRAARLLAFDMRRLVMWREDRYKPIRKIPENLAYKAINWLQ